MRLGVRSVLGLIRVLLFALTFSGVSFAAPVISSLSPSSGLSGTQFTITGSGFGSTQGSSTVKFTLLSGSVSATVKSWSDSSIVAVVPSGLGTTQDDYGVQVSVAGVGSNQSAFVVTNPMLFSISPSTGPLGAAVTLTGLNFGNTQGTSAVKFGSSVAQITSWGSSTIVATVPSNISGSVSVKVTVGGVGSPTQTYTVSTNPFISNLSANAAPVNTEIIINGVNFGTSEGSSTVTVNGTTAIPSSWSNTAVTIPVPEGATTGSIVVTVNGIASNGYAFMVTPVPTEGGVGFVQGNYSTAFTCDGTSTTMWISFPVEVAESDLKVIVLNWRDTAVETAVVADTLGNAYGGWYGIGNLQQSGNGHQKIWFSADSNGGSDTISVNLQNCVASPEVIIAEYKGISTVSYPVDLPTASSVSSNSSACNSGNATTTNQNDLLIGANLAGKTTTTPGSGYTSRVITTPAGDILEDRIVTAAGSYSATATMSASGNCGMSMTPFKEATNLAPVVNAGPNQVLTLPANTVTLEGSVTDDGLPNNTLTITWSKVSGPGTVTFGNSSVALTQATFSASGTYVLQLTANDSQLSGSATTTVTVSAGTATVLLNPTSNQTVTVAGTAGPWLVSGTLNSAYSYSSTGSTAPTVVPVTTGQQMTLQYQSGLVSIGGGQSSYDGKGVPSLNGNASPYPAQYISGSSNAGALIGAWTDATGQIVARPFVVNDGTTLTAPTGAAQLQLGVDDTAFADNTGTWTLQVQSGAPGLFSSVGPDSTNSSQTFTAAVTQGGAPLANASVQFTVTGANATTGNATTNANGIATFSYAGSHSGSDSVQASSTGANSNVVGVAWITPVQSFSTSTVLGKFYQTNGSCVFYMTPAATPAFMQTFPTINFNPPAGTVPGNTSGVTVDSRPITDITTDLNGNYTGSIVAQGNGYQAGWNTLNSFQAEFSGSFTVASAGNVTINLLDDDGFILGIGGGATRVSGPMVGVPTTGTTPFTNFPVLGSYNTSTPVTGNTIVVNFPTAGTYPYELDYTECNGGELVLTMALGSTNSTGTPPTGSLTVTANNSSNTVGQSETLVVQAKDASGAGIPNLGVALDIYGANQQFLSGTTNASGQASIQYTGTFAGQDTIQAIASVGGMPTVSNVAPVTWSAQGGGNGTYTFMLQGWIATPASGTVATGQVPITLTWWNVDLASGTLKFFPVSNPSNVTVLNSNTVGTNANLGTFDATLLPNGQYVVQLQATSTTGANVLSEIVLNVQGESKPGREVVTVTDFKIPLAGMPIDITRTYDSLNRGTVEDFGNGWKLGASVELSVDLMMNVTLTANGKRQTFYFTPQSAGSVLFSWMVLPYYTPQPGLHGTLTSNGCSPLIYLGGALVQDQAGVTCALGTTYQPTVYTYTDPVGRAYTVSNTGQLQSIKDLNGNILTFTPSGITSSAGNVVVPFVRDGQNRITQITDLNGKNYVYTYDTCGTGDLCTVTFPALTAPARYTYSSDHSLLTQVDPNGNTTTNTYDSNGRLQTVTGPSVTGANGSPTQYLTQYSYNLTTNTTTVTNPDGGTVATTYDAMGKPLTVVEQVNASTSRTTTYQYDSSENLISLTDACGNGTCSDTSGSNHTTTYTYDSNGNQTSITDPLQNKSTKTYNQFGGITSQTDAANTNTQTTTYDANFNSIQTTDLLVPNTLVGSATYDTLGNVLTSTDANGKITSYTYDPNGNLIQITDALNETTNLSYDAMDRLASRTDPLGNKTAYGYDDLGRLVKITDPLGHTTQFGYDNNSNKTSQTDANNNQTIYQYDALNRLTQITYPTVPASTQQFIYDFRGNRLSETDQSGHVTKYVYDLVGELTGITYGYGTTDAGTVSHGYDLDGRVFTTTDELNNVTTSGYDAAGRLATVTDATNHVTTYGYDADNRRTSSQDANQNTTTFAYDLRSRLTTVTYPIVPPATQHTTTQNAYDGVGRTLSTTDQAGKTTTNIYDDVGRLSTVQDAMVPPDTTKYQYDLSGNLQNLTDAAGRITSYRYDALNRMGMRILPLGMFESYAYDNVGNLLTKTDFNNFVTTYGYDQVNRLLSKAPQSGTGISFTYTPTGKRATMTDPSGSTTYTYDNRDRLKIKATPEGALNYTFDAHSNLKTITSSNSNGASVAYGYDVLNRLSTVADNRLQAQGATAFTTTYNYDPESNLLSYTVPNGVVTTNTFDPLNRLATTGSAKGSALSTYAYARFAAGNVNSVTELNGRLVTYGYDNIYRLTSEAITSDPSGNNGTIGYQFDQVGNRLQRTSTLAAVPAASYSYDANDRLTTDTYDNNGNTIFSAGIAYTYDFENRLLSRGAATIVYDGDGNRVSETAGATTTFLIDTLNPTGYSQVMDEIVNGSVTRTYTYGMSRISENQLVGSTWTPSFYGYDGHMNVRSLSNIPGALTDTYQYDAFGSKIASTGTTTNNYLFNAELFDQNLSLYHLRARYYNPLTGRFMSRDSNDGNTWDPKTLHKYLYAAADPVNRKDPTGRNWIENATFEHEDELYSHTQVTTFALRLEGYLAYSACVLREFIRLQEYGTDTPAEIALVYVRCAPLLNGWPAP
jgi:RHS repeat-associated protein